MSLLGGCLGGFAAAIASNPADCTISEMKKKRTGDYAGEEGGVTAAPKRVGPREAASEVYGREGTAGFFRGLGVRMVFYR